MATFIKAGFWEKLCKPCKGYKGWLNLDELIQSLAPPAPEPTYKVYTALLTQDAECNSQSLYFNPVVVGRTYFIASLGEDSAADFTTIGAPSNTIGTYFVATSDTANWGIVDAELGYDTGAPTVIVLENTLGGDVTYTCITDGVYRATLPINYTSGKLWFSATANNNNANAIINYNDEYPTGTVGNTVNIITLEPASGVPIATAMYNTSIEIRVYN